MNKVTTIKLNCECMSFDCTETIETSLEEAMKARENNQIVIVSTCHHGPEGTDTLVEKKDGYSIYVE